ncbi:hypothetical protein PR202_ga17918 [Eleusine coracana subsp. coracana]|uniref:Carboxypeptidase n=1 Tax=Eleusine coracana subsp. coracana TaxID=191504 RepID=A0AAV5CQ68_ELECO|nr:hypothetical protein PR202_ga17918 [Eleusine coracana subsp. coracana]
MLSREWQRRLVPRRRKRTHVLACVKERRTRPSLSLRAHATPTLRCSLFLSLKPTATAHASRSPLLLPAPAVLASRRSPAMTSGPRSLLLHAVAVAGILLLVVPAAVFAKEEAWRGEQERDRVPRVPGQPFNPSFAHYAGYVTVSEQRGAALFYWFFEAAEDPGSKPLVLWLNGGKVPHPRAAHHMFGVDFANILFLDSPVGVGYSYSNTSDDVLTNGDARTENSILMELSFGLGHYVPQLAQAIKRHHEATGDKSLNLKGYMVCPLCIHLRKCEKILDIASAEAGNIDSYSIFTPTCHASFAASKNKVMKRLHPTPTCLGLKAFVVVIAAVVVIVIVLTIDILHSEVVNTHWGDCERSVLHIYHELMQYGLRIWVFSGDTDAVIPVTSTRYSVDALKLPTVTPWHAWYDDDGEVGGWSQGYEGLTFVTVRGAGHEVPLHRPKQALTLFKSFLAGSPMPVQSNMHSDM